jgi:CRISPR-associated protein (TIGR02584 family)
MSPAVLTETIWALAHEPTPIIPDRVVVVTTTLGRDAILSSLFKSHPRLGGLSPWQALRGSLAAGGFDVDGKLRFGSTPDDIRVFTAVKGDTQCSAELSDLRNPLENDAAADFLLDQTRGFIETPDTTVIASLAGGRKTMGALLYGCLTLLGRETDRLTHVLVNEPFETLRDFWFPTQPGGPLLNREGHSYDPAQAHVQLASVPFVPLRNLFERDLAKKPGTFRSLVNRCSQRVDELARNQIYVEIAATRPMILVNGVQIDLSVAQYITMLCLARRVKEGEPAIDAYKNSQAAIAATASQVYAGRSNDFDWRCDARAFAQINEREYEHWLTRQLSDIRKKLRTNPETAPLAGLLPQAKRFSLEIPASNIHLKSRRPG